MPGPPRTVSPSERKRRRALYQKSRRSKTVYIGEETEEWNNLREGLFLENDGELAKILLKSYLKNEASEKLPTSIPLEETRRDSSDTPESGFTRFSTVKAPRMEETEDSKRQLIYSSIISQHADHLLTKLYVQFIKRRNCDLTIKLSDMWLYAHTCVVDAFTGNHGQVKFKNLEGKSVLDLCPFRCDIILPLIEMMYTGELAVIPNLVEEVADAARFLGFQEAYKGCEVYMRLHKKDQEESCSTQTTESEFSTQGTIKSQSVIDFTTPAEVKGQSTDCDFIQIKQEPVDDYETPSSSSQSEPPFPVSGILQNDSFGASGLYRSLEKREVKNNSPDTLRDTASPSGAVPKLTDSSNVIKDRAYAGNWAKNTMNLNEDFASHKEVSRNVYTVLPNKPSTEDLYSTKKRGRPRKFGDAASCDGYPEEFNIDVEVDDVPPEFYFEGNDTFDKFNISEQQSSLIDKISKELTESIIANEDEAVVKGKVKAKRRKQKTPKQVNISNNKKYISGTESKNEQESGLEAPSNDFDNSYIEVKQEVIDNEYEDKETETNKNLSVALFAQRRSKRKRAVKKTKQDDFEYDYESGEDTDKSRKTASDFQAQMDDDYSDDSRAISRYSGVGKRLKKSSGSTPIISPSLLKGKSFVGTVCQNVNARENKQKRSKGLKKYQSSSSVNYNDSDSDSISESEPIEVPVGVKLVPPVAVVPEGVRSRYTQPTVADIKDKFVMTPKGGMKKVATVVKYKPKIFQGHQQKNNSGPVYVMCHPTKPIVRL